MVTILHNPRCSKSRQALELLRRHNIEPTIRDYLKNPLSKKELQTIAKQLGLSTIEMIRTKEPLFKELKLSSHDSDAKLLAAIALHPILLERPIILFEKDKAVIGRPTEAILPYIN